MEVERRAARILAFSIVFRSRRIVMFCLELCFVVAMVCGVHPFHMQGLFCIGGSRGLGEFCGVYRDILLHCFELDCRGVSWL